MEVGDSQGDQCDRQVDCPGHPYGRTKQFVDSWVLVEDAFPLGAGTQFFGNTPTHCRVVFREFLVRFTYCLFLFSLLEFFGETDGCPWKVPHFLKGLRVV